MNVWGFLENCKQFLQIPKFAKILKFQNLVGPFNIRGRLLEILEQEMLKNC